MNVHKLLADFQPQPQKEGQERVSTVLGGFVAHRQVSLLDDIGGIDTALERILTWSPKTCASLPGSPGTDGPCRSAWQCERKKHCQNFPEPLKNTPKPGS
jgi:hypothetical protein